MKNLLKRIFGITEMEEAIAETRAKAAEVQQQDIPLSEKDQATQNKEPWVAVLNTHVNKDNIRNGFFELDWNEYFIVQLRSEGYTGSSDEEIVDQWFQELCRNIGNETGIDMERRGSGFVQRALREDGKTEVS
jgi:hypothetical protein